MLLIEWEKREEDKQSQESDERGETGRQRANNLSWGDRGARYRLKEVEEHKLGGNHRGKNKGRE